MSLRAVGLNILTPKLEDLQKIIKFENSTQEIQAWKNVSFSLFNAIGIACFFFLFRSIEWSKSAPSANPAMFR